MKEATFRITQSYRSDDEQVRKARLKAIIDPYLIARLQEKSAASFDGGRTAGGGIREETL